MFAGIDQRPTRFDRRLHDRGEIGVLSAKLHLALADAAHVEQIIDQMNHLLQLTLDDAARVFVNDGLRR